MPSSNHDNHQTFSTFSPAQELSQASPREMMSEVGDSVSVSVSQGETNVRHQGHDSYKGETPDTWHGTATDAKGYRVPPHQISEDTFVQMGDLHAKVGDLLAAGILTKNADGSFSEPSRQTTAATEQADPEIAAFPDGAMDSINEAMEPVPDHALDNAVAVATLAAIGKAGISDIAKAIASPAGMELGEASDRVQFIVAQYQAQADSYLSNRGGISSSEVAEFYDWAKGSKASGLQAAMRAQLNGSMSGWKGLAQSYQLSKGRI